MKRREHFEATMGHKLDLEPIEYAGGEFHYYENTTTQLAWEAYQAAVPEGWQAVPIIPTVEIENAISFCRNLKANEAWEDALAVTPELPVQREGV